MSDSIPSVLDPSAAAPKKKKERAPLEVRRARLEEKLAKLRAQEAKARLEEAIKSGECADPEKAKQLAIRLRALTTTKSHWIATGLVTMADVDAAIATLQGEIEIAVNGE